MKNFQIPILFTLLSFCVNFNLFIEPRIGFLVSIILLFALNLLVWQVIKWGLSFFKQLNSEAVEWSAGIVVFALSIYGYGLHVAPTVFVSLDKVFLNSVPNGELVIKLYRGLFYPLLVIISTLVYFITKHKKGVDFIRIFLVLSILIVAGNRINSYYKSYHYFVPMDVVDVSETNASDSVKPDIYYFLFDGYTGNTSLKKYWNFDNSAYVDTMRAIGFQVLDSARTHYAATIATISSVFNLSEFKHPKLYEHNMDFTTKFRIRKNPLFELLQKNGYVINTNGIFFDQKPFFFSQGDVHPNALFFTNIVTRHLVYRFGLKVYNKLWEQKHGIYEWDYTYDKSLNNHVEKQIANVGESTTPMFFYNHFMTTHPSYRYTAEGERVDVTPDMTGVDIYVDQIKYTNKISTDFFTRLVDEYKLKNKPLVIIAQSDHGSKELKIPEEEMQIQMMVYDSEQKLGNIPQTQDGVNMMRKVANVYLGLQLPEHEYRYYDIFTGNYIK
jgi:tetrahydromethanopterin S-methyltransferase subunit F